MKTIVHITADYPDPLVPAKTPAIKRLVEGTPQYRHVVYSLNRVAYNPLKAWKISSISFDKHNVALTYPAPPKGILMHHFLKKVAAWIVQDLKNKNIQPDLIHAHKLSVEGLVANNMRQSFSCRHLVSLQGNSDVKIIRLKKSLRPIYQDYLKNVFAALPFSVWPLRELQQLVGLSFKKTVLLPVVPDIETFLPPVPVTPQKLVTVFHLSGWKLKNLPRLIDALKSIRADFPLVTLDVYGGGDDKVTAQVQSLINRKNAADFVKLKGPLSRENLQQTLQHYSGFVLAGLRETYGLVYVEALMSGLPILYGQNMGIDGIFENPNLGVAVEATSTHSLCNGLKSLLQNEADMKKTIADMQQNGGLSHVQRDPILSTYSLVLDAALYRKSIDLIVAHSFKKTAFKL